MNLWNKRNLSIPPINTYKATDTKIDINHLKKIFLDAKIFFDNENYMRAEYAVLSTIVYRSKQKFRSAKDFKALEKVYKALGIYLKSNVSCDLKKFMDIIPSKYRTDETYLPNKNVLDYILIRLQGLVKLLERIVETCKITAYLFDRRMHTGHFWKMGFIIFSIVSRIYVVAKYSTKFICDFYNKVVPFSRQLKNNGRNWLPKDYILPNDLQQWLNVDWLDVDDELQIVESWEVPDITQFIDLVDDDIQFCDEYIMVCDDEKDDESDNELRNSSDSNVKQNIAKLRGFDFEEDIGEVIQLDDNSVNSTEMFPQEHEENDMLDVMHDTDSSEDSSNKTSAIINIDDSVHLLCDTPSKNITASDGIIEIDDSVHLPHDNFKKSINEVINLDDSSVSHGKDINDVLNFSNSLQTLNENVVSQNIIDICDSSSQSIIILDNSPTSESQDTNRVPLLGSEYSLLKTPTDPVHIDEKDEITSNSVIRKKKKQKKMERALLNKQKKQRKIRNKIGTNQLNKENSTVLPNFELNKKVCVNGSSTLNFKANDHTNILINNKQVHRDANKLLMKKGKHKTRKRKETKELLKYNTHEVMSSNFVKKSSENVQLSNEKVTKKMNKKKRNNIVDMKPKDTKLKQVPPDYDINNKKRKMESNIEHTEKNMKKQKTEGILMAKVNQKKQNKINSKLKLQKESKRNTVRKNNIKPMESKNKKLKLSDNAVKFSQQTNINGVPKDNNSSGESDMKRFKSLNNTVKPLQQKNIGDVPKENNRPAKSKKRKHMSKNAAKFPQQTNINSLPKDNNRPIKSKKGKLKAFNNIVKLPQQTSISGVRKDNRKSMKSKKKKLKSLGNVVKVLQPTSFKHIVNQVHYNTQNMKIKSKPKKKNKHRKNK